MKLLLIAIVLSLAGCATGGNQAYQSAHDSASKRGIAEAQANTKARETEALASASAAKACETDVCRVAVMGFANMRQMIAKNIESVAPNIAAPVDPMMRIGEKLIDAAVTLTLGKFGLDAKLSDNSRTISAGDPDLARQINQSNTLANPFADTTTAK